MHAKSLQLCLTLCDLMDCSPPGSSVHGISQARILEWVAISSSRDLPYPEIEPASLASAALQEMDSLPLSHQESPRILEWVAYPSSGGLPDPAVEPGSP